MVFERVLDLRMRPDKIPTTQALRMLRGHQVIFEPVIYRYIDNGGAHWAAQQLSVPEHAVIKTLVMMDDAQNGLIILMHGDMNVSTRALARQIGKKQIHPCDPQVAQRLTGYQVGGISPFGIRTALPVYAQSTIFDLPTIWINAGHRGLLACMAPAELRRVLNPVPVDVATQ